MNATMAITSEKKSSGESNIKPPRNFQRDRPDLSGLRVKSFKPRQAVSAVRPSAPPPHTQARRGPLLQHLAAEAKQCSRPSTGLCRHHAGGFDQRAGFHQPAEILLVQMPPRDRFPGPLQLRTGEFGRPNTKDPQPLFTC